MPEKTGVIIKTMLQTEDELTLANWDIFPDIAPITNHCSSLWYSSVALFTCDGELTASQG